MITRKDHRAFSLGLKLLKLSLHSRYQMIALLYKGGRLISVGVNKEEAAPKTYIKDRRANLHLHAEISALHGIDKKDCKNGTIYVVGKTRAENFLMSKPCWICLNWMYNMGIKRIVYHDRLGELLELE